MLDKTTIEVVKVIKNNSTYVGDDVYARLADYIGDEYMLDGFISKERIQLELEMAFVDVSCNIDAKFRRNFMQQFINKLNSTDIMEAYRSSLHLLQVKDGNGYVNGFWDTEQVNSVEY